MTIEPLSLSLAAVAILLSGSALTLEVSRRWTIRILAHAENHHRVTRLEQQVHFFSRLIEQTLAIRLRAPAHPDMDRLLRKLASDDITIDEARTLYQLIIERSTELQLMGPEEPDLSFPRLMTLWSLEVRMAQGGQPVDTTLPWTDDL